MQTESIQVGQDFTVTCNTLPLSNLQVYTDHKLYYKRPDGKTGYVTPTSATGSTAVGAITNALNPLTGRAGTWEFYLEIVSGSIKYYSKKKQLVVSELF